MGATCSELNISWLIAAVGNAININDLRFTKPW
jgi:hypothetical protein